MNPITYPTTSAEIARAREFRTNMGTTKEQAEASPPDFYRGMRFDTYNGQPPQQACANPADFDIDWLAINREASNA